MPQKVSALLQTGVRKQPERTACNKTKAFMAVRRQTLIVSHACNVLYSKSKD